MAAWVVLGSREGSHASKCWTDALHAVADGDLGKLIFCTSHDWTLARTRAAAYQAVRSGNLDILEFVLGSATANGLEADGETFPEMIRLSAQRGRVSVLEMLFNKLRSARGSHTDDELLTSALGEASKYGAQHAVKWLLAQKADVMSASGQEGLRPLHAAACYGHASVAESLLASAAHVDSLDRQGSTALLHAAFNGHAAVAQELIRQRASLELSDAVGMGALHLASLRLSGA